MTSNHAPSTHSSEQTREAQDVRLVVDVIPTLAWSAEGDGAAALSNRRWLDYTGPSLEDARDRSQRLDPKSRQMGTRRKAI